MCSRTANVSLILTEADSFAIDDDVSQLDFELSPAAQKTRGKGSISPLAGASEFSMGVLSPLRG
jgi:hypothetical protein